ncbi:MAG TPA: Rieske 2Fe-2S domain-containing protein [Xanthobacteraceae bacterium]|nr:Rieske 2Fe-2S domain-containing protein [Xanthobacteraceae bacterium]
MNRQQQDRLTRIGPGTAMGELLRRYWFPVAVSSELGSGGAQGVRLLDQALVLFRTTDGTLGLLDELCTHRGSSLRYGHVDDEGIICPYHGRKFSPEGRCLSIPTEREVPKLLEKARTRGYPVQELGGLIFAYLGPAPAPLLPRYDLFVWNGVLRDIGRALIPCNWLQIMENSVDPTHVEWLHGHHLAGIRRHAGKAVPTHYAKHHVKIGFDLFRYGIVKRRVVEGATEHDDDWEIGHPLIFPCMLRVGTQEQHRFQIRVPIDDTHTMHYWYSCYRPKVGAVTPVQTDVPVYEVPWRDNDGNFIVDFVDGGDIMAWVTQGPIADRTRETLASSDSGIVLYRRLLMEQARKAARGEDPIGVIRDPLENTIIEFSQEHNKFRAGAAFLREAIEMSHVRYSPIKERIVQLLEHS